MRRPEEVMPWPTHAADRVSLICRWSVVLAARSKAGRSSRSGLPERAEPVLCPVGTAIQSRSCVRSANRHYPAQVSEVDGPLIEAAVSLITAREGSQNHTVAAAARDAEGGIHSALNLYHFTGGPCAEQSVMAAAAAATHAPLTAIVAVGDHGRGVIAPCGRCRQVLLDYFPDVEVIVPSSDGPRQVPIQRLLPWAYAWVEHQQFE